MPRKRQGKNFGKGSRRFRRNAFCAGNRSPAGRSGVAGHDVVIGDRATLNVGLWAPRAVWKNFAARIAVFRWVGINQEGRSAFPLGSERFESSIAVRIRIPNNDDLAFNADSVLLQ